MNGQWLYLLTTCANLGRQLQVDLGCLVLAIGRSSIQLQARQFSFASCNTCKQSKNQNKAPPNLKMPDCQSFPHSPWCLYDAGF